MSKIILSINAGSSSVKVSVFTPSPSNTSEPHQLAEAQISGLTSPPAKFSYSRGSDENVKNQELSDIKTLQDAYSHILQHLIQDSGLKEVQKAEDIGFACHRIVHGGDYTKPTRIDHDAYEHISALSDLAPLHNAGALALVKAVHDSSPTTTNIAFFDTAFHATLPAATRTYAIAPSLAQPNAKAPELRKYGFHGLSYAYVFRACCAFLGAYPPDTNIIALHLGSGCSITCIEGGKSIDTSMGLTPLSGLPGATRSGDVDASLVFHLTGAETDGGKGVESAKAEELLNSESGWKALTGTADFSQITSRAREGDKACQLAFDILVDRIAGYIGAYFVKLQGEVKALVFAGGIGENSAELREAVLRRVKFLSFIPDFRKSEKLAETKGAVVDIGFEVAEHRVLVCRTDEQAEMARECLSVGEGLRGR